MKMRFTTFFLLSICSLMASANTPIWVKYEVRADCYAENDDPGAHAYNVHYNYDDALVDRSFTAEVDATGAGGSYAFATVTMNALYDSPSKGSVVTEAELLFQRGWEQPWPLPQGALIYNAKWQYCSRASEDTPMRMTLNANTTCTLYSATGNCPTPYASAGRSGYAFGGGYVIEFNYGNYQNGVTTVDIPLKKDSLYIITTNSAFAHSGGIPSEEITGDFTTTWEILP